MVTIKNFQNRPRVLLSGQFWKPSCSDSAPAERETCLPFSLLFVSGGGGGVWLGQLLIQSPIIVGVVL